MIIIDAVHKSHQILDKKSTYAFIKGAHGFWIEIYHIELIYHFASTFHRVITVSERSAE